MNLNLQDFPRSGILDVLRVRLPGTYAGSRRLLVTLALLTALLGSGCGNGEDPVELVEPLLERTDESFSRLELQLLARGELEPEEAYAEEVEEAEGAEEAAEAEEGFGSLMVRAEPAGGGAGEESEAYAYDPAGVRQWSKAVAARWRQKLERARGSEHYEAMREFSRRVLRNPAISGVEFVKVNEAALASGEPAAYLGSEVIGWSDRLHSRIDAASWQGELGEDGLAIVVDIEGRRQGWFEGGEELYALLPVDETTYGLAAIDQSRLPPDHDLDDEGAIGTPEGELPPAATGQCPAEAPAAAKVVVTALVLYTPAARDSAAAAGSHVEPLILTGQILSQAAFDLSGAALELELVGIELLDFQESGNNVADVAALRFDPQVGERRDQLGADLVLLVVDNSSSCGRAAEFGPSEDAAFAVVSWRCIEARYSMTHEIGHLFGAHHDEKRDSSVTPFSYQHGFHRRGATSLFRTVMSYDCPGPREFPQQNCRRRPILSNPRKTFAGFATGTAGLNDNVCVINQTAPMVAAFRP